jgi:hypothetical protein
MLATIQSKTFCFLIRCLKNIKITIYKIIILPVVLDGYETWSLILREEHRLRVFENMVLRRIFGPKGNEVIRSWRKLHNEGLHNLSSWPRIIRMIKSRRIMDSACSTNGESRNLCRILVGKPEGKRPLGRLRCGWVDNIKLILEVKDGVISTGLIWLRIVAHGGLL